MEALNLDVYQTVEYPEGKGMYQILNETGVEIIMECLMLDFDRWAKRLDSNTPSDADPWDIGDYKNWDYLLSGIQEVRFYSDYMRDFAMAIGAHKAANSYATAYDLLDQSYDTVSDMLDYACGNVKDIHHDFCSYDFWKNEYFNLYYIDAALTEGFGLLELVE